MSETQHGSVVPGAAGSDAETGEADDVSEYSEEAGGLDPAGEAEDAPSADGVSTTTPDAGGRPDGAGGRGRSQADGQEAEEEEEPDDAREEFERELRMLPGTGTWCTPTRVTRTG